MLKYIKGTSMGLVGCFYILTHPSVTGSIESKRHISLNSTIQFSDYSLNIHLF